MNKLRLPFELSERFCCDWPLKEHPGVYWLTSKPRDSLPEQVLQENEPVEHLKWILKETMGAPKAYALRLTELGSPKEALESFVREARPGGRLFEYLTVGRLAVQVEDVLFVHGGLPRAGEEWKPGWLPPTGEQRELKEWLEGLEQFKMEQLQQVHDIGKERFRGL